MKKSTFPFYPFLVAAFPVLSLIAYNKFEIQFSAVFRPLIVALLFGAILYGLSFLIFRKNWQKAALITGTTLILFFSYGHVFRLIQASPFLNDLIGRHPYVVGIFGLIWLLVLALTIKLEIKPDFTKLLNIFSIILVALPLLQMGWFYLSEAIAYARLDPAQPQENYETDGLSYSPDVYYIILDMYARPDTLLEEYEIDVTDFVEDLEDLGFYYASESQSNYGETFKSLSTSLNMQLIDELADERDITTNSAEFRDLIIHSDVRSNFESLGYQTIAFSTGYRWSEVSDADIYYEIKSIDPLQALTPFELLLVKNLIVYPFRGDVYELFPSVKSIVYDSDADYTYLGASQSLHVETQRNVLEKLPQIANNKNPTFTFAHILIPHPPFVFDVDGSLLEDPGYYSGESASAVNAFYELDGYTRQVKFISQQIESIVRQILADSETESIIIIQGDHGWKGDNRYKILNLYYFPNQDYGALYPSITPVNTFRAVFDTFYGFDTPLVEDESIISIDPISE